jgi:DNA polymerase-3 subunit alpha
MKTTNYKFAHHHVHCEYSPWDAPISLKKLVEYSKKQGYRTVTVTDHGTVGSWVKLATMCKEQGVKPIFGIEAYFTHDRKLHTGGRDSYHLVLLAKNNQGIKNIFQLSELAYSEGYYYDPRIDWDLIRQYHDGIICTSGCVSGIVPYSLGLPEGDAGLKVNCGVGQHEKILKPYDAAKTYAQQFKDIFGKDFFLEVQYHGLENEKVYVEMTKLAKDLDIKLVGTNDVHYLKKEDANVQEAMMTLNMGKCIKDTNRLRHDTNDFYLKSPDEMVEIFGGQNSAPVQGALEIADVCTAELEMGKTQLPSIEIPKGYGSDLEYLEALARKGMKDRGKEGNPIYEARFKEEIDVLKRLKEKGKRFDRYFLIVWDYVNWAWNNGIRVGAGRGSGVGSLLLYCLKITGLDPIPYDLLFERFLAEDRNEMPDIDIDFDWENGYKVYDYICSKYGIDHCAHICAIQTFHVASAIKSAFRVFDSGNMWEREFADKQKAEHKQKAAKYGKGSSADAPKPRDETVALANSITKMLPQGQNGLPSDKCTLLKEVYDKKPDEITYVYNDPQFVELKRKYPNEFGFAEHIEGLISNRSIHAAGILITEDKMVNLCPQQLSGSGKNKRMATVFDMGDCERLGGVKFDFLQTKVLSVITYAVEMIKARYPEADSLDIDNLPVDDPLALKIFGDGNTLAIFQFESRGMRELLRNMRADSFENIIAANALYRPGPMKFIDSYCKRKNGAEKITYVAPAMAPVIQDTYGIIVYQEQVMRCVRVLAGFSGSESDKVRKAMGKKKADILAAMKQKFMDGCEKMKTCSQQTAAHLWVELEDFSRYAFNKSHAAGYSYTAYQCAWLKAHYPHEFMAAQLTIEGWDGKHETVELYENGLRSMGIELLPACVNNSRQNYTVVDMPNRNKAIRKGFKGISGLGEQVWEDIVAGQRYKDMYDYCYRAKSGTRSDVFTALLDLGAFDSFKPKLAKRLGKEKITKSDLQAEYNDKVKRAQVDRKEAEKNKGMTPAFSVEDEDVTNFVF